MNSPCLVKYKCVKQLAKVPTLESQDRHAVVRSIGNSLSYWSVIPSFAATHGTLEQKQSRREAFEISDVVFFLRSFLAPHTKK